LDACVVPQAHGQVAARGTEDLAASPELASDYFESVISEIA
jgi:hypothetical protein